MCDWGHCPAESKLQMAVWGYAEAVYLLHYHGYSALGPHFYAYKTKLHLKVWLIWPFNFQKLSVLENMHLSWTTAYQSMAMWSFLTADCDIDVSLMSWRIFFFFFWPSEPTHLRVTASLSFRPKLNGYPPQQLVLFTWCSANIKLWSSQAHGPRNQLATRWSRHVPREKCVVSEGCKLGEIRESQRSWFLLHKLRTAVAICSC